MTYLLDRTGAALTGLLDWASQSTWRQVVLLLAVAALVILPGIASMPVTDRDEGRFVQASKQMLETGDLIDIRFQEQPRWKKPVGIYWLQAASASFFGGTEAPVWAYRIPSAVAGLLVALLTSWAARPLIGARGATLAGLMMATTLLLAVEGNIAKTDAALAASGTAALGALVHLIFGQGGRGTALVLWLAISVGILLKGPIIPVIVLFCLVWFWICRRERPAFARLYPLPGLILTLVLVAPWLVAIYVISDGAFFAEALGRDLGGKLVAGQEKHWGPPGLYAGIVWGTFWPWAAFIPVALPWLWANRRAPWVLFLAGWVIPFWIVLEAVPTKLPHYVLPLYPAMAILIAGALLEGGAAARAWIARLSGVLAALPGMALGLALIAIPVALSVMEINADDTLLKSELSPPAVALGLIGALFAFAAGWAAWTRRLTAQIGASLLAAVTIFPAVLQFGLPAARTAFPSPAMAEIIAQYRPCASGPAFSVGYHEPSLVFQTETSIRMADPNGAMDALRADPGTMVLLEDRWWAILGDKVPKAELRARITYFNYNRGKTQSATLMTQDDPRWAPCVNP